MKKFLAFILCFVYVVASSGATINFHYCMGKFIGWDVSTQMPETCNNCGMHKEAKKGCCNDKHATFQIKKDQLATTINAVPYNSFTFIQHQYSSLESISLHYSDDVVQSIHGPPLIQQIPAFIFNCVFRI